MDYFEKDGLVRNAQGRPVGRVVLAEPYVKGENLKVAMLMVPKGQNVRLRGSMFYVDGIPYKVPADLPDVKVTEYANRWVADTFVMEKVE